QPWHGDAQTMAEVQCGMVQAEPAGCRPQFQRVTTRPAMEATIPLQHDRKPRMSGRHDSAPHGRAPANDHAARCPRVPAMESCQTLQGNLAEFAHIGIAISKSHVRIPRNWVSWNGPRPKMSRLGGPV